MNLKRSTIIILVAAVVALGLLVQSAFTVHQTEKALVLQLGKPVTEPLEAGLHFKLPFIQNTVYFDARLLDYDTTPAEILTKDKKNMVVDNYAKWRITNPLLFYRTVKTLPKAQARLDDIIYAMLREALGRYTLIEVVADKRDAIMQEVTKKAAELLKPYGIFVEDVRIKRTDLPPENERAIFGRMRAERERMAKQYRSEGQEEGAKIKAMADKDRAVILAEATREANVVRGQGDAESIKIFARAVKQSPEFYAFQKSLDAYKKGFKDNTRMILTPNSEFFKYMK